MLLLIYWPYAYCVYKGETSVSPFSLYRRFGGPMAVALELCKGPLVYALQKYDFFVIFPVNPSTLAKYREAFTPSRAKDDPTDAELALDLIQRHADRFTPLMPLRVTLMAIKRFDEEIAELAPQHPDYELFRPLALAAFKWIRILYRCWVTRTPYDEAKYLKALQERGSPLLKMAEAA